MAGDAAGEIRDARASYAVERSETSFRTGRVIAVRTDVVRMPHGSTATRDVVDHPGAVGVIAVDDRDRVLLVRQYRHPVQRLLWEPPAGLLDQEGEPPLDAVKRELVEEAGHRAAEWHTLVDAFTSPGMTDEAVRIYLARGLERVAADEVPTGEHEERDMPVAWLPLDDAVAKVLAGDIHNPLAVMGLLAAAEARRHNWHGLRPAEATWPEREVSGRKG